MSYTIKDIFYTVQGEGYHAGTAAVFIRFAGCNLWDGRDEHRERDADRNVVECPRWCDTDFAAGERLSAGGVCARALACVSPGVVVPLIVFTGGEPLLQLDHALLAVLRAAFPRATIAIETNGTVELKVGVDWVCVSPKVPPARLRLTHGDELKVVVPTYDPRNYATIAEGFEHCFISAEAATSAVGQSVIVADNLRRAAAFVMEHPTWRLTLQSHKIIGVP